MEDKKVNNSEENELVQESFDIGSVLEHFDDFTLYLQSNNYSSKTVYNYSQDLLVFARFLQSRGWTVNDLSKKRILELKAYLTGDDRFTGTYGLEINTQLSSASVNRCLSAIRAYIKFLLDQDLECPVSPDFFKMVKRERPHPHVAELYELIDLIEAPSKLESNSEIAARNRAMLETLFATGMRISELVNLNKRDLDGSGRIFITGKGRKQRFVYLTERATHHLNNYLSMRQDSQQALFVPLKGKSVNRAQRRITPRYVQERLQFYRERLKINLPISPHALRHGFATYLAEEGASPVAIQMLLGHESLATTTRYVNASDRFAEDAHRKYHPLAKDKD